MNNKLTVEDLPESVVERMKKAINEDVQMVKLRGGYQDLIRRRQFAAAMDLKRRMKGIEERVINEYLATYEGETVSMQSLMGDMSVQDRDEINVCTNSIILMCDMIETFVMDFNQILQKYHPDYKVEMYDKILAMGKEAKEHVRFMSNATGDCYQCAFADSADDLTEMVRNKAKAIIKKVKAKDGNKK